MINSKQLSYISKDYKASKKILKQSDVIQRLKIGHIPLIHIISLKEIVKRIDMQFKGTSRLVETIIFMRTWVKFTRRIWICKRN